MILLFIILPKARAFRRLHSRPIAKFASNLLSDRDRGQPFETGPSCGARGGVNAARRSAPLTAPQAPKAVRRSICGLGTADHPAAAELSSIWSCRREGVREVFDARAPCGARGGVNAARRGPFLFLRNPGGTPGSQWSPRSTRCRRTLPEPGLQSPPCGPSCIASAHHHSPRSCW
jgi:hypothetical protein